MMNCFVATNQDRNFLKAVSFKAILLLACLVAVSPSYAQLTFGGSDPAEEEVEEQIEEGVEEDVEEQLEETVEEQLESDVDGAVEEEVVDQVEESTIDEVEDQLTFGGSATPIEDKVEEQVEESAEEALGDELADDVEDFVEGEVIEATEQQVVDTTEEAVEDSVDATVDDEVEESVVAANEEQIEESVESEVLAGTEQAVEGAVEASSDELVESSVEQASEEQVEEQVSEQVAAATESSIENSSEESVEQETTDAVSSSVDDLLEESASSALLAATDESASMRMEAEVDEVLDTIESDLEVDTDRISRGQWLVMAEPSVFDELAAEGYIFDAFTELSGLGLRLAEVAAPASFDISAAREGIIDVVGADRAQVDLNHIYTAGVPDSIDFDAGWSPSEALDFPVDTHTLAMKIGIVDSAVDTQHEALIDTKVNTKPFTRAGIEVPTFHGTAIASIVGSNSTAMPGLAPNATIFAASVFEIDEDHGEVASTVSLVRALDWLLSSGVDAINLSLAGPPNRLLEVALQRVASQQVVVVAAAGNGGPMALPKYPAAYESVVAVTAVDREGKVFRLANRGDYLDLAAPGVQVRHAVSGGGYAASSGTSFAVPFAATAAARLRVVEPGTDVIAKLYQSALDLGDLGRDEVYGYGLLVP